MMNRLRILLLFLALGSRVAALEVRETRWGFDGRAVPGKFTIFSVLVAEPGPKAFDGNLSLFETRGLDSVVGAPLVQPIYLTPGTQRWVQFVPFVANEFSWKLRWGPGEKGQQTIDAPKRAGPAVVLLLDPNSISSGEVRLRGFPDDLFPTTVAATDTLDQVAMDHVPRWDAPRREAFLDWLRRGGIVHLLRGPGGYPIFEGDMAVLNTSLRQTRAGAGFVVRHDLTRAEFSEKTLQAADFSIRELKANDQQNGVMFYGFDQTLLRSLASLTKPEVAWWLLYLLTIGYLIIIGPVHYRWSRRVDYRLAIGGFLGTVAAFALAFILAGARGSGEKQTAHTVGIATALGGARWDVTQWYCAFATSGDYYTITHESPINFYSATSDNEAINGRIFNGKDGHFEADIPLFSTRPFLHRAVMSGPPSDIRVDEWTKERIAIELPESFQLQISEAWLRRSNRFYKLSNKGRRLTSDANQSFESEMFFNPQALQAITYQEWSSKEWDMTGPCRPLMARFIGDIKGMENPIPSRSLGADHAQVFLWAKAPASFALKAKDFRDEQGWVLFVADVFAPDTAPATPLEK